MGAARRRRGLARRTVIEAFDLELPTGKAQVLWDQRAAATPLSQLPYFLEFLHVSGLMERWVRECPLRYVSPNTPGTTRSSQPAQR